MSSVYGGSTMNIAAAGAANGSEGCFLKSPGYVGKVQASDDFIDGDIQYDFTSIHYYMSAIPNSHLCRRAWVLQERLLSPRTLYFGKGDIFWECKTKDASESFPEELPSGYLADFFHRPKVPLADMWPTVIELYTRAKLTYSDDKLVAISGIAKEAQNESGDQYFAGFWRRNMEFQLYWRPCEVESLQPRPQTYRAPSWSVRIVSFLYFTKAVLKYALYFRRFREFIDKELF